MSDNALQDLSDLEREFNSEVRGYGSLSVKLVSGSGEEFNNIGYQIRPEDIEALYFEGIGTPRWESIEADSVNEQLEIYNDSMREIMADYPLIYRVQDTDKTVVYTADEITQLLAECTKVLGNTENNKAVRAVQKFVIAGNKAAEQKTALHLKPS